MSDLISKILGLRLSINSLTPSEIKNFILNFGLVNEALLSKKQKLNTNNQKVLITQLVRMLTERGFDAQSMTRALLDIEASQLETNQSLQNRELFFSLIFPFKEFGTWNFSFSKMKEPKTEEENTFTFNLHTKNEFLGEVWLRVLVENKNNLHLQMWATDKHTFTKSLRGEDKLYRLLNDAGLNVSSFEVFNEARPGKNKTQPEKPILNENIFSGSTIDVEA